MNPALIEPALFGLAIVGVLIGGAKLLALWTSSWLQPRKREVLGAFDSSSARPDGTVGDARVTVDYVRRQEDGIGNTTWHSYTRFTVLHPLLDHGIDIAREPEWKPFGPRAGGDVTIGDPTFDSEMSVYGTRATLLACMDDSMRAELRELIGEHGRLAGGRLEAYYPGALTDPAAIDESARRMVRLVDRIVERSMNPPRAFLQNVQNDRWPLVRRNCLRMLLDHHPWAYETMQAVKLGVEDQAPDVRCLAAMNSETGRAVLEDIARNEGIAGATRAMALDDLFVTLPFVEMAELLGRAATSDDEAYAVAAVRALGRAKGGDPMPLLLAVTRARPVAVAEALCDAFLSLGDDRAEERLLEFLGYESEPRLQLAAIRALQTVGSVKAVEPLLRLSGFFHANREDARAAVRAIQARLGDADAGRLSISGPTVEQGAMSVAAGSGALSKVKSDGGGGGGLG